MPQKPERKLSVLSTISTISEGTGVTQNGAIVILSLVKETSDVFPPLKSVAAFALSIVEGVKVIEPLNNFSKSLKAHLDFQSK